MPRRAWGPWPVNWDMITQADNANTEYQFPNDTGKAITIDGLDVVKVDDTGGDASLRTTGTDRIRVADFAVGGDRAVDRSGSCGDGSHWAGDGDGPVGVWCPSVLSARAGRRGGVCRARRGESPDLRKGGRMRPLLIIFALLAMSLGAQDGVQRAEHYWVGTTGFGSVEVTPRQRE